MTIAENLAAEPKKCVIHEKNAENQTVHTSRGLSWSLVDVIVIEMTVSLGTWKFLGKSTCGDTADGAKTAVVLGVVVVSDEAPDDGVVVVVAPGDGIFESNEGEVDPSG